MHTYQLLTYRQQEDGIVEIALNRPEKLNALNRELCAELDDALARSAASPGLRALILSGNGRAFSAGMDLQEIEEEPMSERRERRHLRSLMERCLKLWEFPVPVIAAVHGYVLGHACDLAQAADFTIAAADTQFGVPEIRHGGGVAALLYPYAGGMKGLRRFLYTGDMVDAAEAQRLGLVSQIVAAEDILPEARRLAARLAAVPADALRQMKRAVNRSYEVMGLRDSLEYNLETLILSHLAQPASYWAEHDQLIATGGLKAFLLQRDGPVREESS
jgi:enoyl-CoA hydratase/carnithine racemase